MAERSVLDEMDRPTKLVLGGGAATVVAAFLPWLSIDAGFVQTSVDGIDVDGVLTIVTSLAAAGLVVLRDWDQVTVGGVVVLGGLVALIGARLVVDPMGGANAPGAELEMIGEMVSPGIGLYLTVLGGLVMIAGGYAGNRLRSTPATGVDTPDDESPVDRTE